MTPLSSSVINQLVLARHLFRLAEENLRSQRTVALFAAVNLMQDAVEAYLVAASEALNAGIDSRIEFDKYFLKIEAQTGQALPSKQRLLKLNKARVNAKHHGITPDRGDADRFAVVCREFFTETSQPLLGVDFWSISLIDLLEEGEVKQALVTATAAVQRGEHVECLVDCRKAIFLEIEQEYNVSPYQEEAIGLLGFGFFGKAPYYARNKKWVDENVKTPFEYIVLDHDRIDRELLAAGVRPAQFWNLWRMTPSVFVLPRTRAGWFRESFTRRRQLIWIALRTHWSKQSI